MNAAGHGCCCRGGKKGGAGPNIVNGDQMMLRRFGGCLFQQSVKPADAGCGAGGNRPRRQGMDTDFLRPKFRRHRSDTGLKRGFDRPHDIIVLDNLFRAVKCCGQQAAAVGHQRFGKFGHADERMTRNAHGNGEPVCRAIDHAPVQIFLRAIGNGMEKKIQSPPGGADAVKNRLKLSRFAHITGQNQLCPEAFGKRADMRFSLGIDIGHGKVCAGRPECFCAAVGDACGIGNADNKANLARQINEGGHRGGLSKSGCAGRDGADVFTERQMQLQA